MEKESLSEDGAANRCCSCKKKKKKKDACVCVCEQSIERVKTQRKGKPFHGQ